MIVIKDKITWNKYLSEFDFRDYFFEYDYINTIKDEGGEGYPEAAYYEDEKGKVFYPYLRRPMNLEWIPEKYHSLNDITSPFGSGGYLHKGDISGFFSEWNTYVKSENIVTEFIRHHPFLLSTQIPFEIIKIAEHIYIDLSEFNSTQDLFRSFRKGHKSDIKFAEKKYTHTSIDLLKFENIFSTFTKTRSLERQFQTFQNFSHLKNEIKEIISSFGIYTDDMLVTASMFLSSNNFSYYFSSGNIGNHRGAYSLLVWKAMEEAWNKRINYFSLGGGIQANDSIFAFKKGFSDKTVPFYISRIIHDQTIYDDCVKAREAYFKEKGTFFPAYRKF